MCEPMSEAGFLAAKPEHQWRPRKQSCNASWSGTLRDLSVEGTSDIGSCYLWQDSSGKGPGPLHELRVSRAEWEVRQEVSVVVPPGSRRLTTPTRARIEQSILPKREGEFGHGWSVRSQPCHHPGRKQPETANPRRHLRFQGKVGA